MKSFRGTFIFTAVVIAACLFSYFQVFKKGNEDQEKKEKDSQLYKLKADEVTKMELSLGDNLISLQKNGDAWMVEKPLVDKADQTNVKNFIDTLLREKTSDIVDENQNINFKTYGLDAPAFRLKLTGTPKDSKTTLVEDVSFGSVKAYDGSMYSRFGQENKVYLSPSYLGTVLMKKVSDFRNKNLFLGPISDIDRIKVAGTEKTEMLRTKEGWTMEEPKKYPAPVSNDSVQAFLDLVRNLKGTEIVEDDKNAKGALKKYHLEKPAVILSLHRPQEPQNYEMKISDPKEDKDHVVYLMGIDANGIMKGVPSNLETINKVAFDFTNKTMPFTFGTMNAEKISVSTDDFKAELKKVGSAWKATDESDHREVDSIKAGEFIDKFSHLEAGRIVKSKAVNFKNSITISDADGKLLFNMKWGEVTEDKKQKTEKLEYVQTTKMKELVTLTPAQIESLGYKKIVKDPDPIQFSGSPPPKKSERPKGAALDQHLPKEK